MRMKALAISAVLTLGVAGLSAQSSTTVNGFISDSHCGAAHSAPSADAAKCVKSCMKGGSEAVLVSQGKVYKLKGEDAAIKGLAGQNVTVSGTVSGDTITVTSISAPKS